MAITETNRLVSSKKAMKRILQAFAIYEDSQACRVPIPDSGERETGCFPALHRSLPHVQNI